MDYRKPPYSSGKNATGKHSGDRSAKLMILQTSLNLFSKELTEGESNFWLSLLDEWTVAAMRYAFDNWNRNGRFFPKPKDILEQIEAYRLTQSMKYGHPTCDSLCRARHGQGYGSADMWNLFESYRKKIQAAQAHVPMTDELMDELLDKVDKKRGGSPEWRRQ